MSQKNQVDITKLFFVSRRSPNRSVNKSVIGKRREKKEEEEKENDTRRRFGVELAPRTTDQEWDLFGILRDWTEKEITAIEGGKVIKGKKKEKFFLGRKKKKVFRH